VSVVERRTAEKLARLAAQGLDRRPPSISARDGVRYRVDGTPVIGLCSNDYLGLADTRGSATVTGSGGSRLICGDLEAHRELEARLAALAGTDDAVLFPSGYQLNAGVLPALVEPGDTVYSDALNHASLIDGLRLARASVEILEHLAPPPPPPRARDAASSDDRDATAWWITESTFSMDGDVMSMPALAEHLANGGASYVDEAHAIGLYEHGRGLLARHDITPTLLVAPLGKAFGVAGAFVAASDDVCRWIRSRARSFVFSTGTSPVVTAAIARALDIVCGDRGDELRDRLWRNARLLAELLGTCDACSPIFPVIVGRNHDAIAIADELRLRGWHVQAIRPPTVPEGTARLRVTVTSGHDEAMLVAFVDALREVLARHDLPLRVARGLTAREP
jgi:7-keto-8-aminopelargonate synthetase-like enzyme